MFPNTKFRRSGRLTVAVVAAVVPFAVVGPVAQAAPNAQARLATAASKTPNRTVEAIVQFKPSFSEKAAKTVVKAHGGKVTGQVPFIHGLVVKLPAKQAKLLAKEPKVVGLTLNSKVHSTGLDASQLATSYPKTTRADKLWQRGITGAGIGVGVIDTGIAGDQPDFKDAAGNSRVVANVITSPGAATAGDGFGHGTHVAGIIAGDSSNRAAGDPFKGKYVGMAPGANLIAIKASDDAGNSTVLDVINGIAFAVDHKATFNLRVLNLSLAADTPQSYKTDPLDAAVEYAWQKGIVVVVASGNRGSAADAVQYAPANDPFVISVGGVDESGNSGRGDRADWSSNGVTQDGISKPEVVAPGAHMVSVLAPSSAFMALCPNCSIGGQYFKAGGTSMAAPVVSGAVALLLQARPTLTPNQVKALLMGTDKPVAGNKLGTGMIDVERALYTPTYHGPRGQRQARPEPADRVRQPRRRRHQQLDALHLELGPQPVQLLVGPLHLVLRHVRRDGRRDRPAALHLEPQHLVERRRGRQRRGRAVRGARRRGRGDRVARRPDPHGRRGPANAEVPADAPETVQ